MNFRGAAVCFLTVTLAACASEPAAPDAGPAPAAEPTGDAAIVASAMAAAPDAVSSQATVLAFGPDGQMRTVREGTNGWTCMPDNPQSPGNDPMCLDQNGLEWAKAWMEKRDPPAGKMGFGYMLMGGSDASNDDPFVMTPPPGHQWVDTGPHVMIFNIGDQFAGYPTSATDTRAPYIMWADTPYRHLMVPVR